MCAARLVHFLSVQYNRQEKKRYRNTSTGHTQTTRSIVCVSIPIRKFKSTVEDNVIKSALDMERRAISTLLWGATYGNVKTF